MRLVSELCFVSLECDIPEVIIEEAEAATESLLSQKSKDSYERSMNTRVMTFLQPHFHVS